MKAEQIGAFAAGVLAWAVATIGPLDARAHGSLTAHMAQHVLLLMVAAPLLVAGGCVPMLVRVVPGRTGAVVRRAWRRVVRSHAGLGWMAWTGGAIVAQTAAMWIWHLPGPFEAALRHPVLHGLEHMSFLATAMVFWWAVSAGRRDRLGAAVIAVFIAALPGTGLGAALTFANHPWYPTYAGAGALADQQMAGVVMWSVGGFAYVVAAAVLFARWMAGLERALPPGSFARVEAAP
ncbi:MAG: cytochrome c oxidase assembly protein [Actinobacteria bacterium]|nr:cytochrome c oxidase assembly protein [Actinomycetota bacterium]